MSDPISNVTNEPIIRNLQKALDGAASRQKVISNNVANVDTPNFKRSDVEFQNRLRQSFKGDRSVPLSMTQARHIPGTAGHVGSFPVIQDTGSTFRNDGNNVDIEREMVEMAKNNLYYNASMQMIGQKFNTMKYVIEEGK